MISSQASSKLENDSMEDSEVDNRLEKIHFADVGKGVKSETVFVSALNEDRGVWISDPN